MFLLSVDEDDEDQCIRLLSFCKKHRQPSNDRVASDERFGRIARSCSDYTPPLNPSGCARTGILLFVALSSLVVFLIFSLLCNLIPLTFLAFNVLGFFKVLVVVSASINFNH